MGQSKKIIKSGKRRIFLLGVLILAVYWVAESLIDSAILLKVPFAQAVFSPGAHETWMRLTVALLISFFVIFAQIIINRCSRLSISLEEEKNNLKELKELFEGIAEGIPEGIILVSRDLKIIWANKAMLSQTGYTAQDILGKHCYAVTHNQDSPCRVPIHTCPISESIKTGKPCTTLHTHFDKDGKKIFVEVSVYPIKDNSGNVTQFIHLSRDISERKRLENLKDEFVNTVSHELRTPLAIIKESIEVLLDRTTGEITKDQADILSGAKNNIERLGRIVDNLLDISRIESGRAYLNKNVFNLSALVKDTVFSFEPLAKEKGLEIRVKIPEGDLNIFADSDRMSQVFINLIGNAIKFTNQGFIEVSVRVGQGTILCSISDTGIGIAAKDIPQLFQKFHQLGRKSGSGAKGTGLGLSITKEIIQMHGGNISVESQPDKGTTFTFSLPEYTKQTD